MKEDIVTFDGRYTKIDTCPENPISWRFFPMRRNGKVGFSDVMKELFDQGMSGGMYAQLFRVPEEFPEGETDTVEIMEPDTACKILAEWCGFKLYDRAGKQLV